MIDTKEKFLALMQKTIRSEDSYDRLPTQILEAYAQSGERLSTAITRFGESFYPSKLGRGAYETGTLTIYRSDVTGTLTIPAGTVLKHMLTGEQVSLDSAATYDINAQTATVAWTALEKRFSNLHKNSVMYLAAPITGVTYAIFALVVTVAGVGEDDGLLAIGDIRGIQPQAGETDKEFRRRFRDIPDKVTLPACLAVVQKYFPTGTIVEGYEETGGAVSGIPVVASDDVWMFLDTGLALSARPMNQAFFKVQVPAEVVTEELLQWFTLGDVADCDAADSDGSHLGYVGDIGDIDTCDAFLITPIPGTQINPSTRRDIALMCAELDATKAAGVSYIVEEV